MRAEAKKMRVLGPRIHGYVDVAAILVFALAPFLVGLGGSPALISWGLALVFLILTLFTRYPMGVAKQIPFFAHGLVELAVAVFLAVLPRIGGYSPGSPARRFYSTMAVVIAVVWLLTDYRGAEAKTA
jgi:hypothetical protein